MWYDVVLFCLGYLSLYGYTELVNKQKYASYLLLAIGVALVAHGVSACWHW